MICNIAELYVDVPDAGDMRERCAAYLCDEAAKADFVIREEMLDPEREPQLDRAFNYYLETGYVFYRHLLAFGGFMLHSCAVAVDGRAYLFSGPSGMGKSTHAEKYLSAFGERACIINDDKPAIRRIDGKWFVYGTPWSGKNGINRNVKAPLAGICFLRRGERRLTRLSSDEALRYLLAQSHSNYGTGNMARLLSLIDPILRDVPIFEFRNSAEDGDERRTWEAMLAAAIEKEQTM